MAETFRKRMQWISWGATLVGLLAVFAFLRNHAGKETGTQTALILFMVMLWLVALFVGMCTVMRGSKKDRTQLVQGAVMVILANVVMLVNATVLTGSASQSSLTGDEIPNNLLIEFVRDRGDIVAARILAERVVPEAQPIFEEIIGNNARDVDLRIMAASALGGLCVPPIDEKATTSTAFHALLTGLKDPAPGLPEACADALSRTGAKSAVPALLQQLEADGVPQTMRIAIVRALGRLGAAEALEPIQKMLADGGTGDPVLDTCCERTIDLIKSANPEPKPPEKTVTEPESAAEEPPMAPQ